METAELNEWATYRGHRYRVCYDARRQYGLQWAAVLDDGTTYCASSHFKAVGAAKSAIDRMANQ